jgi:hypothetical protein
LAFWLSLALVASPVFCDVKVDHDPAADFGSYHTYGWREGTPAASPEVQEWIVEAIDRELQEKGLRRVEGEVDLYVSTVAYGQMDVDDRANYVRLRGGWGVITSDVVESTTGHLIVDLIDAPSDEPVWRGVAEKVFKSPNLNKARKKIEKMIEKMFAEFPPE